MTDALMRVKAVIAFEPRASAKSKIAKALHNKTIARREKSERFLTDGLVELDSTTSSNAQSGLRLGITATAVAVTTRATARRHGEIHRGCSRRFRSDSDAGDVCLSKQGATAAGLQ